MIVREVDDRFALRNGDFFLKTGWSDGPAMVPSLTLRPAALADLNAIMAIERTPGFERYVGHSPEAEHRR